MTNGDVRGGQRRIQWEIEQEPARYIGRDVGQDVLTRRETEVLRYVAAGNSNGRIAQKMARSEETVKAHMKSILAKLAANDRTHAVTIALRRGIISL